jgi:hypothetical protein
MSGAKSYQPSSTLSALSWATKPLVNASYAKRICSSSQEQGHAGLGHVVEVDGGEGGRCGPRATLHAAGLRHAGGRRGGRRRARLSLARPGGSRFGTADHPLRSAAPNGCGVLLRLPRGIGGAAEARALSRVAAGPDRCFERSPPAPGVRFRPWTTQGAGKPAEGGGEPGPASDIGAPSKFPRLSLLRSSWSESLLGLSAGVHSRKTADVSTEDSVQRKQKRRRGDQAAVRERAE